MPDAATASPLIDAWGLIAEARRELWWFIETYAKEYGEPLDDETVTRALRIQDDLLAKALTNIEEAHRATT